MACQGPNQEIAHEKADKAFEEVWKLICEKHHIFDYDKSIPETDEVVKVFDQCLGIPAQGLFYNQWKKAKTDLQQALRDLYWAEACQSF